MRNAHSREISHAFSPYENIREGLAGTIQKRVNNKRFFCFPVSVFVFWNDICWCTYLVEQINCMRGWSHAARSMAARNQPITHSLFVQQSTCVRIQCSFGGLPHSRELSNSFNRDKSVTPFRLSRSRESPPPWFHSNNMRVWMKDRTLSTWYEVRTVI